MTPERPEGGPCTEILAAALAYAARGWHVLPVAPRRKVPILTNWQHAASTNPDRIRGWWAQQPDANVGISCGPSGLLVMDVDDPMGLELLEQQHGELPETLEAMTGRPGGRHLYFIRNGCKAKNSARTIEGIDIRTSGGFVVAPPSVHATGTEYAWDGDELAEPAELPGWLALLLDPPDVRQAVAARPAVAASQAPPGGTAYGRAALEGELATLRAMPRVEGAGRNVQLNKSGFALGQLIAGGQLEEVEVREALLAVGHEIGLEPREVQKTVASGVGDGRGEPRAPAPRVTGHVFDRGDECELAAYWLEQIEAGCGEVVADVGAMWGYEAGSWEPWDEHELRCLVGRAAGWGVKSPTKSNPDRVVPLKMGKNARANAVEIMMDERMRPRFFDGGEPAVVFADVAITLDKMGGIRVEEHSRDHRATVRYPFKFGGGGCPRWQAALATWFEGAEDAEQRIAVLQEFAGAALFGIAPRYQRALLLVGRGANGKSQALKIIEGMFPRTATCQVSPQQIGGRSGEYYLAHLVGKRLNVVSDMPASRIIEAGGWKAVVAGEPVTARQPAGRAFGLTPRAGHLFSANQLPGTRDQTDGFWRRWLVVPFDRVIPVAERVPNFAESILADELPGIVAWAIEGAALLTMRRDGYTLPASHEQAMAEWRRDADSVAEWIHECCDAGETSWTATTELYKRFAEWSRANGRQPMSSAHFGRRLQALGLSKRQHLKRNGYCLRAKVA